MRVNHTYQEIAEKLDRSEKSVRSRWSEFHTNSATSSPDEALTDPKEVPSCKEVTSPIKQVSVGDTGRRCANRIRSVLEDIVATGRAATSLMQAAHGETFKLTSEIPIQVSLDSEQFLHDKATLNAVEDLFEAAAKLGVFAAKTVAILKSHKRTKKRPFDVLEVTTPHTRTETVRLIEQ
jgi:hypothetical protein